MSGEQYSVDWLGPERVGWESGWLWYGVWGTPAHARVEFATTGLVVFPLAILTSDGGDLDRFYLRYDAPTGVVTCVENNLELVGPGIDGWELDGEIVRVTPSQRQWLNEALMFPDDEMGTSGASPDELLAKLVAVANLALLSPLTTSQMDGYGISHDEVWKPPAVGVPPDTGE